MTKQCRRPMASATSSKPPDVLSWLSRDVALLDGRSVSSGQSGPPMWPSCAARSPRPFGAASLATVHRRATERSADWSTWTATGAWFPRRCCRTGGRSASPGTKRNATRTSLRLRSRSTVGGDTLAPRPLLSICRPPERYAVGSIASTEFFAEYLDVRGLFAVTGLPYRSTAAFAGVVTAEVTLPADAADLL